MQPAIHHTNLQASYTLLPSIFLCALVNGHCTRCVQALKTQLARILRVSVLPGNQGFVCIKSLYNILAVSSTPDGPTPVPSESSLIDVTPSQFVPKTPPINSPIHPTTPPISSPVPITTSSCVGEEDLDSLGSPPSLIASPDSQGKVHVAELEDLHQPSSSASSTLPALTPVLSISLSKLPDLQQSSSMKPWPISASQVKSPLLGNLQRNQISDVGCGQKTSTTMVALAPQISSPSAPASGEKKPGQASKLTYSSSQLSKPSDTSEIPKGVGGGSKPVAVGYREKQLGVHVRQQKLVSDMCTEDDDDDVIEIEDDSELDTSLGGGEGEEKGNGASVDTPSSDDEWDESLLPPRCVVFQAEPYSTVLHVYRYTCMYMYCMQYNCDRKGNLEQKVIFELSVS